jgi:hypothetical protein
MKKLKEFAEKLNGRQYLNELTKEIETYAKENGIVVVFGQSDDLMELRGAIDDEYGCFDGRLFSIDENANVYGEENGKLIEQRTYLNAIWCPENTNYSWAYEINIPHETFDIMEDDEYYCKGIVFYRKDLKPKRTNYDKITESVETLAEFLELTMDCSECVVFKDKYDCYVTQQITCKECIKEWLQKECEDEK